MGLERHVKVVRSAGNLRPARQRGPGRHPETARMKCNRVVMECFYRCRLMKKVNLLCLKNEEIGECLNQRSNVCVTKHGQEERMAGYQNLNWKQSKDNQKMTPRVTFVEGKISHWKQRQ